MRSQELLNRICDELATGKSLRAVCRLDGMPTETAVRLWAREEPFSSQYTRARELGYLAMAEEIIEISDDGSNDTYENGDGDTKVNHDHIARSKLRVDSRKWMLAKMLPKIYGDKVTQEHTGANGAALPPVVVQFVKADKADGEDSDTGRV